MMRAMLSVSWTWSLEGRQCGIYLLPRVCMWGGGGAGAGTLSFSYYIGWAPAATFYTPKIVV